MDFLSTIEAYARLASEVIIVLAFLFYLHRRDKMTESLAREGNKALTELALSVERLTMSVERRQL